MNPRMFWKIALCSCVKTKPNWVNILTKLLKTLEINDVVFPLSLKYLQNTNRIITSKYYVNWGEEKKETNTGANNPGGRKSSVGEVTGWLCILTLQYTHTAVYTEYTAEMHWYLVGRQYGRCLHILA